MAWAFIICGIAEVVVQQYVLVQIKWQSDTCTVIFLKRSRITRVYEADPYTDMHQFSYSPWTTYVNLVTANVPFVLSLNLFSIS